MSVIIFANGDFVNGDVAHRTWIEPYLEKATALIAADGGARHIRALGLWPDVVIGDMDSLDPASLSELQAKEVKLVGHPAKKDETDLELALRYAAANYETEIFVAGAMGGRLDQLLANVFLLTAPFLHGKRVKIVERHQEAWIMEAGDGRIDGQAGDLVSLLPLGGDVLIGRTKGLAWPLHEEKLLKGMSRGVSNRMTVDVATVEVRSGTLLCVRLARHWER